MGIRKHLPSNPASTPLVLASHSENPQQASGPPYPDTQTPLSNTTTDSSSRSKQMGHDQVADTEESSSENEWDTDGEDDGQDNTSIPPSLQSGQGKANVAEAELPEVVPPSLQLGGSQASHGSSPARTPLNIPSILSTNASPHQPHAQPSTNPYLRNPKTVEGYVTPESTAPIPVDSETGPMTSPDGLSSSERAADVVKGGYNMPHRSDETLNQPGALQSPVSTAKSVPSNQPPAPQYPPPGPPSTANPSHGPGNETSEFKQQHMLDSYYDEGPSASAALSELNLGHQPAPVITISSPPTVPSKDTHPIPSPFDSQNAGHSDASPAWDPRKNIPTLDTVSPHHHVWNDSTDLGERPVVAPTWEEQKEWDQAVRERRENEAAAALEQAQREEMESKAEEEWFQGEQQLQGAQTTGIIERPPIHSEAGNAEHGASIPFSQDEETDGPSLPPRQVGEHGDHAPPKPPRPQLSVTTEVGGSSDAQRDQPRMAVLKQTSETYPIKHINWSDGSMGSTIRRSPILVQNANGPCPLLALVNALTLTTPAAETTALVETLRVREQVSLGLLLDAVFDELISGRRGDAAQELPDVSELYQFLITLHTGMNVNPSFVPPAPRALNLMDAAEGSPLDHAANQSVDTGSFEQTREMRLYSTFSVPLIHGWLPRPEDPTHAALARSAKTYEDAQNLLFREEELEMKLRGEGLSPDEQQLLQDIVTIKYFLSQSATQLTPNGLDAIVNTMGPGSVAILFRNDHFSTLYKHPHSHQLLQLVTDAGYAGHEEVVWESLVDVNGERCEFYAGDFRPVGNAGAEPQSSRAGIQGLANDEAGWTTVGNPRGNRNRRAQHDASRSANERVTGSDTGSQLNSDLATMTETQNPVEVDAPRVEQEDHDLALALQLQEEEEDRHRREVAAREREESLSQRFLSQESRQQQQSPRQPQQSRRPNRARGSSSSTVTTTTTTNNSLPRNRASSSSQTSGGQNIRPLIPPRRNQDYRQTPAPVDPEAGVDVPPPSYEQAAGTSPYHPPPNHPAHPSSSPNPSSHQQPNLSPRSSRSSSSTAPQGGGAAFAQRQPPPQHLQMGPGRGGRRIVSMRDQLRGSSGGGLAYEPRGAYPGIFGEASPMMPQRHRAGMMPTSPGASPYGQQDRDRECVVM